MIMVTMIGVSLIVLTAFFAPVSAAETLTIAQKNSGKILLQVESHGEAWYVNPKDLKKYSLGKPADAFAIIKKLGIGISNANLGKIPRNGTKDKGNQAVMNKLKGKIVIQVQGKGEAWYVHSVSGKRYSLGKPATAFAVIKKLGSGITNANLAKIPTESEVLISEVIDGDTVKLSDGNKVRILAINTPETKDPRKLVQCFGAEALKKMTKLVKGKKVKLIIDASQGDKDKYGRLLRYIYIESIDIGAKMIQEGYAYAYLEYPTSKTDEYKSLENQARESKRGLWAENVCNGSTVIPSNSTNSQTTNKTSNTDTPPTTSTQPQTDASSSATNASQDKDASSNLDCSCDGDTYNCSDFSTHAEAQALHNCCMQKAGYDIHKLDGNDKDGLACESLP